MATISEIQRKLKQFNSFASESDNPVAYQKKWNELFHMPLSSQSAHSFASYYKDMRSNTRKHQPRKQSRRQHTQKTQKTQQQRGGAAPLDYVMTPGLNIQAYGRFPIEAGTDSASIQNLDVYFQDSLTKDCGVKDSSLHVPANMGSNQVGGDRRSSRNSRNSRNSRVSRRAGRKVNRTMRRHKGHNGHKGHKGHNNRRGTFRHRQRGGDLLESITARMPFVNNSSVSPNFLQTAQNMYTGGTQAVPAPADPSVHLWEPRTHGVGGIINPGLVAYVPNDVGKLANPAPWTTSN